MTVTGEVKKEKKLKKAVVSLIDFEAKANAIEEDGSQKKSRVKKTPKDSEPEGNIREVTVTGVVKKEKKLKKAVALLKIDFEAKAIAIEEDGSKMKSRVKKTRKIFDV